MSVKDLIWVNVCQQLRLKRNYEFERIKRESRLKDLEQIVLLIADIREVARDTNMFTRLHAIKGTNMKRIDPFPKEALPSVATQLQREEEKKIAKMTPEELELYRFNKGEKIKR